MKHNYYCGRALKFPCSNLDQLQNAIAGREWFRNDDKNKNWVFYFQAQPYKVARHVQIEDNVVSLKRRHFTDVHFAGRQVDFFKIEPSDKESDRIYYGEKLERLICKELISWGQEMNLTTLRAFKNRQLEQYLMAIPAEFFARKGFYQKIKTVFFSAIIDRAERALNEEELNQVQNASEKASEIFVSVGNIKKQELEILRQHKMIERKETNLKELDSHWLEKN